MPNDQDRRNLVGGIIHQTDGRGGNDLLVKAGGKGPVTRLRGGALGRVPDGKLSEASQTGKGTTAGICPSVIRVVQVIVYADYRDSGAPGSGMQGGGGEGATSMSNLQV